MSIITYLQSSAAASISWTASANWSGLAAPAAGDSVYAQNSAAIFDSGLLNTVTLGSLNVPLTFTGSAGLVAQTVKSVTGITRTSTTATATTSAAHGYIAGDVVIVSGAAQSDYNGQFTLLTASGSTFTYTVANTPTTPATGTILCQKDIYLTQPATLAQFGAAGNNSSITSNGSGRFNWNAGTAQTTVTVLATGLSSTDTTLEPLRILGSHASNAISVLGGQVGLGTTYPTETCTFATIKQTGGTLNGGVGLTWSTIYLTDGTMNLYSGASSGTLTQAGGTLTAWGTGQIGTLSTAGTVNLNLRANSGNTVTTLNLNDGATLDLTGNPANIAVGTIAVTGSVTIKTDPANPGHLSWTTLTRAAGSEVSFE